MTTQSQYPMQKIYEEAGFGAEGARRLAGLFDVVMRIRARRQRNKEAEQAQPTIHVSHAGYTPIELLVAATVGGIWILIFDQFLNLLFQ